MGAERPPKPNRPAVPQDDDPTMRVWLAEVPMPRRPEPPPPPSAPEASEPTPMVAHEIPSTPKASEQTPTVALELPTLQASIRRRFTRSPYAMIGAALFTAGMLIGVVGAVTVMKNRAPRVATPAAAVAPVVQVSKVAAAAAPVVLPVGPAVERQEPPEPPTEKGEVKSPEAPARVAGEPPVSRSTAPTCRQLLGKSLVERNDSKAAQRETRLANRELVRGNVTEAHRAYCLALAWDRSNLDRRLNLARLYLVRRDWDKAAEYAQSALKLDSKNRRALGVLGDAWAALHKTKDARAAWLAAETAPKSTPSELRLIVRRNMALAKRVERLQDFLLAERLYRRVLLLEPQHAGAMTGIASCLLRAGDQRAAEAWALKAKRTRVG